MLKYMMVGVGGFFGSIARYWLGFYVGQKMGTRFPFGTFVVNISGSFVGGFVLALLIAKTHLNPNWRFLISVGFIGAYTTFSAFELETLHSVQEGQWPVAVLNVVLSVVVCFMAVWAGEMAWKALS